MPSRIFLAGLALATLTGCPESADIATADMRAEVDVTTNDDGDTEFRVELFEGADGTFSIELSEGDRLFGVTDMSDAFLLEGDTTFRGEVHVEPSEVRVDLTRDAGEDGAMEELMPEPLALDATSFSLADDSITVTWSNPIDGANVAIFVDSCATVTFETPEEKELQSDVGSYTLSRAEIEREAGANPDCAVLDILRRVSNSDAIGFHPSSSMRVRRRHREEIQLTP